MKQLLNLLFCIPISLAALAGPKRVLFIRNSYVATNNLPKIWVSAGLSTNDTFIVSSNAPGGVFLTAIFYKCNNFKFN